MTKAGLTPKQRQVFDFLRLYYKTKGYCPSVREIGSGQIDGQQVMQQRTSSTSVHRILFSLQERGWITVRPGQARSITIL